MRQVWDWCWCGLLGVLTILGLVAAVDLGLTAGYALWRKWRRS